MLDTTVNGLLGDKPDKERVDRFGQTDPCMKVGGPITKPTEPVDLFMLMVMFTMVNG